MDLTTLARVKELLKRTDGADDTLLAQLIKSVSRQIEKHLNRHAERIARTELYDVEPGQNLIFLQGSPVLASPAPVFKNDPERDFDAFSIVDADLFFLDLKNGVATFDKVRILHDPGAMQVVYTGGLAVSTALLISDDEFTDIVLAADLQVAHLFQRKDAIGLTGFSAAGGTVSIQEPTQLITAAKELLVPHRHLSPGPVS